VERLNITLEDEQAQKLARLAERMHVQPGTVARSLLSHAIDEADPDAHNIVTLLDGLPQAFERAQLGAQQARSGETIALDAL
jgi:primosomal protein N''